MPSLPLQKREYLTVKLRIRSDNEIFYRHCNDLEKWPMERGYKKIMIKKQILSASKHSKIDLLQKEKKQISDRKLTVILLPRFSKC